MHDGYELREQEFRDLNAMFSAVEDILVEFATEKHAQLIENYHDVLGRRIDYLSNDGISRSIGFSIATQKPASCERLTHPVVTAFALAWSGIGKDRKTWRQIFLRRATVPDRDEVRELLARMYSAANAVRDEDLQQ